MHKKLDSYQTYFSAFSFQNAVPCKTNSELYFKQICSSGPKLILSLISYLDYDGIISLRSTCKTIYKKINKKIIKNYIRKYGLTENSRKLFWMNNIEYKKMEELVRKEQSVFENENLYKIIISRANEELNNPNKEFFKITNEIKRDLNRTFNVGKLATEEGQEELKRVLMALAYIRPEIGYCQGMNFVAGALLFFTSDEELAFWLFLSLLDSMELNSLYVKNMPDYSIRIYQMNYYVKKFLPNLFYYFKKNSINADIVFSKWILTIFSSYLPFETLSVVWDIFLIDKWKAIFKFSLAFLQELNDQLMKMDLNSISIFFRENSRKLHIDFKSVLKRYPNFKIMNKELDQLRESFLIEQVDKKLQDRHTNWETDQTEALDSYQRNFGEYERYMKKVISDMQGRFMISCKDFDVVSSVYNRQLSKFTNKKEKVLNLIETKSAYENVLNLLEKPDQANAKEENVKKINKKKPNWKIGNNESETKSENSEKMRSDSEEITKIKKKLRKVDKELEKINKKILSYYMLLDNKKFLLEKLQIEKTKLKDKLASLMEQFEIEKKEMMKNLTDKLKLSVKFVKTSQF